MKANTHPDYLPCAVVCNCGNQFVTRSTRTTMKVEVCSACHPFYTGTMKLMDSEGRVDKLRKKFGTSSMAAAMAKKK
mgnify:CR=1 FL=1